MLLFKIIFCDKEAFRKFWSSIMLSLRGASVCGSTGDSVGISTDGEGGWVGGRFSSSLKVESVEVSEKKIKISTFYYISTSEPINFGSDLSILEVSILEGNQAEVAFSFIFIVITDALESNYSFSNFCQKYNLIRCCDRKKSK